MNVDEFFEVYTGGNHNTSSWTAFAIKEFAEAYHKQKTKEALLHLFPTKK